MMQDHAVMPELRRHLVVALANLPVLLKESHIAVQRVLHELPQLIALQRHKQANMTLIIKLAVQQAVRQLTGHIWLSKFDIPAVVACAVWHGMQRTHYCIKQAWGH